LNFFKDYVAGFFSPTPLCGFLLIIGVVLLWSRKKEKTGKILVTLGIGLFLLFGFDSITGLFLNQLENKYPGLKVETINDEIRKQIHYVVVLGGGFADNPDHPLTSQVNVFSLTRLVEGIRIYRELPGSVLIFTGKGWSKVTEAQSMKELALKLGVPNTDIQIENESMNTFDHTQYLKSIIGKKPFILVTSALHMPRAMALFKTAGYKPIPAPTQHLLTRKYSFFNVQIPYTKGSNLSAMDAFALEFWGNIWARVTGKISFQE